MREEGPGGCQAPCSLPLPQCPIPLLPSRFRPQRTIIFHFGQDEECGGKGAQGAAQLLADRNVQLEIVVDEGGFVFADGYSWGTSDPVAMVGTAEKVRRRQLTHCVVIRNGQAPGRRRFCDC